MQNKPTLGTRVEHPESLTVTGIVVFPSEVFPDPEGTVSVMWPNGNITPLDWRNDLRLAEEPTQRVTHTVTLRFDEVYEDGRWTSPISQWDWATILDITGEVEVVSFDTTPAWTPVPGTRVQNQNPARPLKGTVLAPDSRSPMPPEGNVIVRWDNDETYDEDIRDIDPA